MTSSATVDEHRGGRAFAWGRWRRGLAIIRTTWPLFGALLLSGTLLGAQEGPAKRLANIVGVAVEEYGKAVAPDGRLISDIEYDETVGFLRDARDVADRLSGSRALLARAVLDTLASAVRARRPPADIAALHKRFAAALGTEGALDLPTRAIDLAAGRAIYEKSCASCHGLAGLGDGPAAKGMTPPPPALGTRAAMQAASPALMYRVISVGVAGTPMTAWAGTLSADERWNVVTYINSMRTTHARIAEGQGLYTQRCASCHGMTGGADGPAAPSLAQLPPEVASFAWQAERSDSQIALVVRNGTAGTAMPASRELTDTELASVVDYVRSLGVADAGRATEGVADSTPGDNAGTARRVLTIVDEALAAARAGRASDAGDRAFDAYIAFEPLETPARAKNPGLVASMERQFAEFKGAVKANDLRRAEQARNAIEAGLPSIVELTRATTGFVGAFLQSFLIILREGFEAILVIGAVVAFLLKTGHRERLKSIWTGVSLGIAASLVTALVLATVLKALPATREIIEGATMLVAVGVLFSVSYWLISKVEAAKWQQFIREKVSTALSHGGGTALAFVAFLAVYREGAETALFYQALFQDAAGSGLALVLGILVGFAVLAVIFTLFYRYGVRVPLRPFFAITSVLLYYMAFVFMGKGIRELQEGNVVPITIIPGFPHVDAMGLFPTVETLLAQLLLVSLFIFALAKTFWPRRSVALPTREPPNAPAVTSVIDPRMDELLTRMRALEEKLERIEERSGASTRV
jgi:high-affinity iron transporter